MIASGSPATDDHITDLMTRYATEPATTYAAEQDPAAAHLGGQ
jgi:hypothetical protein